MSSQKMVSMSRHVPPPCPPFERQSCRWETMQLGLMIHAERTISGWSERSFPVVSTPSRARATDFFAPTDPLWSRDS